MEPFFDGGVFEILIALCLGYTLNFIYFRKYLLLIYSGITLSAPVLLLFLHRGELYYLFFGLCLFNSILLIILLWKERHKNPQAPLFDISKYHVKEIIKNFLSSDNKK